MLTKAISTEAQDSGLTSPCRIAETFGSHASSIDRGRRPLPGSRQTQVFVGVQSSAFVAESDRIKEFEVGHSFEIRAF